MVPCKQAVELTSLARVVRPAVAKIVSTLGDLRSLSLNKCYQLTSADLRSILASCQKLQALHLEVRVMGSGGGIKYILDVRITHAGVAGMPALRHRPARYRRCRSTTARPQRTVPLDAHNRLALIPI